jgi:cytoskeletal protein CcmA (bactofilin family)
MTDNQAITNAQPSRDPANDGTILGTLNQVMLKMMQGIDDCLPAQVIAFDRAANRATVQPMVKVLATNGETLSRAQIASVPVFQIGGGGYMLNFNLKPGDLGWIKASDRDTSLYLQGCTEQHPNTNRIHSFSDGLFFPQIMTGFAISPEDAENAVWQSLDGTVRVALWPDRVKITAPRSVVESPTVEIIATTSVDITSPQTTVHGKLTVTDDVLMNKKLHVQGDVQMDARLNVAGDVQMDSSLHVDDTIVADGDITAGGNVTGQIIKGLKEVLVKTIKLTKHVHTTTITGYPTSRPIK